MKPYFILGMIKDNTSTVTVLKNTSTLPIEALLNTNIPRNEAKIHFQVM